MTEPKPTYNIQGRGSERTVTLLADLLEHITALELVVDAKEQAVESLRNLIDELEIVIARQRAQIVDLESTVREYQE